LGAALLDLHLSASASPLPCLDEHSRGDYLEYSTLAAELLYNHLPVSAEDNVPVQQSIKDGISHRSRIVTRWRGWSEIRGNVHEFAHPPCRHIHGCARFDCRWRYDRGNACPHLRAIAGVAIKMATWRFQILKLQLT